MPTSCSSEYKTYPPSKKLPEATTCAAIIHISGILRFSTLYPNHHFAYFMDSIAVDRTDDAFPESVRQPCSSNVELLVISSHSIICPAPWRNGTNMNPIHIGDLGTIFVPSFSIADTSFTSVNDAMKHALSRSALWMWTINSPMRSEFMERILSCRITFRMSVLIANPFM